MSFFETFTAVFMATFLGQISLWLLERYAIKNHFNKALDHTTRIIKIKSNGDEKMSKRLNLRIEKTMNGKILLDYMTREGTIFGAPEYETASFNNINELTEWLAGRL